MAPHERHRGDGDGPRAGRDALRPALRRVGAPAVTVAAPLAGRTALVTGGSRGLGRAIAIRLAAAGAAVAVNYRERAEAAEAVVREIEAQGGRALAVRA